MTKAVSQKPKNKSLSEQVRKAMKKYFATLEDTNPANVHEMVMAEVEPELLKAVMEYTNNNQSKAANVLGLGKFGKFFKIILPQTLRLALPNLSNVWQITLKDTSLISVTGLVEIMRQSYVAAGSTRDPLFFYSFAAVLYLLLTFLSMKLINRLEAKYSRGY